MAPHPLDAFSQDDIFRGGVARQVATDVRRIFSKEKLEQAAKRMLGELERLLAQEQRKLRVWVQQLRTAPFAAAASSAELAAALDKLCRSAVPLRSSLARRAPPARAA